MTRTKSGVSKAVLGGSPPDASEEQSGLDIGIFPAAEGARNAKTLSAAAERV
jgi:hypothetical protein